MNQMVDSEGLNQEVFVDSAGTGSWHIGEMPDDRTYQVAQRHELQLENPARAIHKDDLMYFDYILGMDNANYEDIQKLASSGNPEGQLFLIREFDQENKDLEVPDPYWGTEEEFEVICQILKSSVAGFLEHLKARRLLA